MKILDLFVNDVKRKILVHPHDTLNKVLRENVGLTGTKTGCEQGSCGACSVLVDGIAVQSCIYPALKCQGKSISTIEGVAKNGRLHLLQEKFVSKGAIQCGYCTPGMVMTAISFLEENPTPSLLEIKEALSGNLCRCTGYKKIIEAVAEYVQERGESELSIESGVDASPIENKEGSGYTMASTEKSYAGEVDKENDESTNHKMVGKGRPYLEARKKVRGEADYADDIRVKNALTCHFLRSVFPHARILSINTAEAEKLPGVRAVITGKELPIKFGVLPISQDETAIAIEKTRYVGEIVAAIAADNETIAAAACKLIDIEYEELHPFLDMEESLEDVGEHEQIHSHSKFNNNIHELHH